MMASTLEFQKFEEELHWCISQLELGLQRQAPDSRQAAEAIKLLNILRSNKAPVVKKRQAMRNAFGDYRKRMKVAEMKSLSGLRHSRFQAPGSARTPINSRFLKLSHSKQSAGPAGDGLSLNLCSLSLEPSMSESGMSRSQIFPGVASGPAGQVPCASHGPSVSSNGAVLVNSPVFGLAQGNQVGTAEGIHTSRDSAAHPSSSASSKELLGAALCKTVSSRSPASRPADAGMSIHQTHHSVPTHVTTSGCGLSNVTNKFGGFKYEASNNLFVFGFQSPEDADNQEIVATASGVSGPGTASQLTERDCTKTADNVFKYEKSDNGFYFNFTAPDDES